MFTFEASGLKLTARFAYDGYDQKRASWWQPCVVETGALVKSNMVKSNAMKKQYGEKQCG